MNHLNELTQKCGVNVLSHKRKKGRLYRFSLVAQQLKEPAQIKKVPAIIILVLTNYCILFLLLV
jgi:hypothetical protein